MPISDAATMSGASAELDNNRPALPRKHRTRTLAGRTRPILLGIAGLIAFVLVWAVINWQRWVDPASLPGPAAVGRRMVDLLKTGSFLSALGNTLETWAIGMGISAAVAIPVGLVIGWFRPLRRSSEALINSVRSIPATALVPLAILVFGIEVEMKVSLVVFACFWPILLNAIYGVGSTETTTLMVGRSLRWSRWKLIARIVLPSATPYIVSGLRIASGIALVVTFSAELLGASVGVGTTIIAYQEIPAPDFVYAGIVIVGLTGMLLYGMLAFAEQRLMPWSEASRKTRS